MTPAKGPSSPVGEQAASVQTLGDGTATCTSCRSERPESEMRHPLSPSWERLPHLWECVDREACWEAVRHG